MSGEPLLPLGLGRPQRQPEPSGGPAVKRQAFEAVDELAGRVS